MQKHQNPFSAVLEAETILEAFGVDPQGATQGRWAENILTMTIDREYPVNEPHYYKVCVQLNAQGFRDLIKKIQWGDVNPETLISRKPMTTMTADNVTLKLGSTLEVMAIFDTDEEVIV